MIKIEFKEALPTIDNGMISNNRFDLFLDRKVNYSNKLFFTKKIKSITFGCPSELVPSRSEVLAQLGISEQEDKIFQEQYKNV